MDNIKLIKIVQALLKILRHIKILTTRVNRDTYIWIYLNG